jgi:hypothetical protein
VYFPVASVVVTPVAVPERVSVAPDPLTTPDIVYFGTAVAVKFTPVTEAPFIVTEVVDGVNAYPDWLAATT